MKYIQNKSFYDVQGELGPGYNISETSSLEDFQSGKIILLTDQQVAFLDAHPGASTIEVFKMELTPDPQPSLLDIKSAKISEVEAFDISPQVNSFSINGVEMWLDRNTRSSLFTTIAVYKASAIDTITLWTTGSNPFRITLSVIQLENLLAALELYAKGCYDRTAQHKANIQLLETKTEIENYDFTTGYPEKLSITI